MSRSPVIPKNPVYPPSMDWTLLRREGIRHIERLGSAIWTDYNTHDPGITILEVLGYAITDLGYRSNLPMEDLMAPPADQRNRRFFYTAQEVLSNGPVTALDYRKILIDIQGVKNAWVECYGEKDVAYYLGDGSSKVKAYLQELADKYQGLLGDTPLKIDELTFPALLTDPIKKAIAEHLKGKKISLDNGYYLKKSIEDVLIDYTLRLPPGYVAMSEGITKVLAFHAVEHNLSGLLNYFLNVPDNLKRELIEMSLVEHLQSIHRYLKEYRATDPGDTARIGEIKARLHNVFAEIVKLFVPLNNEEQFLLDLRDKIYNALIKRTLVCLFLKHSLTAKEKDNNPSGYNLFKPSGIYSALLELEEGYETKADSIQKEALDRLHRHRNLSEDFAKEIKILDSIPLGVCAKVELELDTDPVAIQALIYDAIGEHLSPTLRFYTLQEMMDRHGVFQLSADSLTRLSEALLPAEIVAALRSLAGKEYFGKTAFLQAVRPFLTEVSFEDFGELIWQEADKVYDSHPVFQGPMLRHGFLDEGELAAAQPRSTVFKSDLYQLIRSIPGVKDVANLTVDRCFHEDGKGEGIRFDNWCVAFNCYCLPRLDIHCSHFHFSKGSGYISPDPYEAAERLEMIRALRTKLDRTGSLDLAVPRGKHRPDLSEFTSVQEDFPITYHVGSEGIAHTATAAHKAKVKQLKGYLLFYDQLLANYLTHLAQVRDIFAVEAAENGLAPRFQPLYDAPNVADLLLDFDLENGNWQKFMDDPNNGYMMALDQLAEGSATDRKLRRNKILDHLLARFGEQFSDYALSLYQIERPLDAEAAEDGDMSNWIDRKKRFLKEVPTLSSQRARGFDYRACPQPDNKHFWESDNVAGLRRRVCAQLGMDDWTRHTISCEPCFETEIYSFKQEQNRLFRFRIKERADSPDWLLESTEVFRSRESAQAACQGFLNQSAFADRYKVIKLGSSKKHIVGFWEKSIPENSRKADNALVKSREFSSQQTGEGGLPKAQLDAEALLQKMERLVRAGCEDDSFHIVEHILLRPRDEGYAEMLLPMICCPDDLSLLDPYSWWITVVVPDWGDRFDDSRRFRQFEQTLRSEAPAHIAIRICKYDRTAMLEFETAYFEWLACFTDPNAESPELRRSNDALVTMLNKHSSACASDSDSDVEEPDCITSAA